MTRQQHQLALAAFDLDDHDALKDLLGAWTAAAERLMRGPLSGEAEELPAGRLSVTLGLGPGVFAREPLRSRRPVALAALPAFAGDELVPARCGGDLAVQVCADGPQVAFHALRTLTRIAAPAARVRWAQTGFVQPGEIADRGRTPRNLWGFREGAHNVRTAEDVAAHVWITSGDRDWMRGGTYMIMRRIRARLSAWDAAPVADQERAMGREKRSGAAQPAPAPDAHVALAAGGERLLRRSYNYVDGAHDGQLDAGMVLVAFTRDPRRVYLPLQQRLAERDALNRYAVHTGSAIFAIPPGAAPGGQVGADLF